MRALLYPFSLAPGGKLAETSDYAQIVRGQVIDALMTNLGERVYAPPLRLRHPGGAVRPQRRARAP